MLDRKEKPTEIDSNEFHLPKINFSTTEIGVDVYSIQKSTLPIVQMQIIIQAGSKYDKGKYGLAHLAGMLIDEGADGLSALEFDSEIEKLGSSINIAVTHDLFIISLLTLKENFSRSFELLNSLISNPNFLEEDFIRERHKAISKTIQLMNDPSYVASVSFDKLCFSRTDYSQMVTGIEQSLKNITLDDIKNFHKTFFSPDNTTVISVGCLDEAEIIKSIDEIKFPAKEKQQFDVNVSGNKLEGQNYFLIHQSDAPQTEIRIGHISKGRNSKDFFAKTLANSILGGQFTSRLNHNLREVNGFTYGINSTFDYNLNISQFLIGTSVDTGNTYNAVGEILKELKGFRGNITESELDFVKSYASKKFPSSFETYSQSAKNLSSISLFNLGLDYFNKYLESIKNVSLVDVKAASLDNFEIDNLIILLTGDREKILDQFKGNNITFKEIKLEKVFSQEELL